MIKGNVDIFTLEEGWMPAESIFRAFVNDEALQVMLRPTMGESERGLFPSKLKYASATFVAVAPENWYRNHTEACQFEASADQMLPWITPSGVLVPNTSVQALLGQALGSFLPAAGLQIGDASQPAFMFSRAGWKPAEPDTGFGFLAEDEGWLLARFPGSEVGIWIAQKP